MFLPNEAWSTAFTRANHYEVCAVLGGETAIIAACTDPAPTRARKPAKFKVYECVGMCERVTRTRTQTRLEFITCLRCLGFIRTAN
jgi:hypothetical protein